MVAERRRTSVEILRRQLKGDLDWIILKAMDKDRTRRYGTAHGLALDVERYLADEPVSARSPSARYRLSKFVRRHRAAVAGTVVAVAAILVGAGAATLGLVRAKRAQAVAEQEAETAQETTEFLVQLFNVSDPSEARGNTITAREILDRGAKDIETRLAGQPLIQARLMRNIGAVYNELGLYGQARPLLERAVALDRTTGDREELANSLERLGVLDGDQGRFDDAERELEEAVAIYREIYGADDPRLAPSTADLGGVYLKRRRPHEAAPYLREALRLYSLAAQPDSTRMATAVTNLGTALYQDQQYDSAAPYLRRALAMRTKLLPPDDPRLGSIWNNLGANYYGQGKYDEAGDAYEHARAIFEKVLGPDHPNMARVLNNLAEVYWRQERYADAERDFLRTLDILRKLLAPDHPSLATPLNGLANVYRDEGRYPAADSLYRRAIQIEEKAGHDDDALAESLSDYADLLDRMGRAADAAVMRGRAAKIRAGTSQGS
jgi:tetratricopeptide (TPR) repeat protein